jgi:predicted nucleic acid-binding protein
MPAVTDTSPLHYLVMIEHVDLLPALYGQVLVPRAVVEELQHPSAPERIRTWLRGMPSWCGVRSPRRPAPRDLFRLGAGEREAILLAQEVQADMVLLDDSEGRKAAKQRALQVTGTLGLLGKAAQRGLADFPQAIARLRTTSFRMPPADILHDILARAAARS